MQQSDLSGVDLLEAASQDAVNRAGMSMPGVVISYDKSGRVPKAVVELSVKGIRVVDDGESLETYALPNVSGPVMHYGIYRDLSPGDEVTVIFADRDIDNAVETGESPSEPNTSRRHHLMDAMILPFPLRGVPAADRVSADVGAYVVGSDGDTVQLGAGAVAQLLTTATKVYAALLKIQLDYDAHTHSGGTIAGFTGVPISTPLDVGSLGDLEADRVKVRV